MPAPLHTDAVAYLKQQGIPVTTQSLNRTMGLLNEQPDLRPSYAGQAGAMDVDVDTMTPTRGAPLPPLQAQSNTNQPFGQAFAAARKQLGAGKTFDWQGKKYTTDYKEEVDKSKSPRTLMAGGEGMDPNVVRDAQTDKFGYGDEAEVNHNAEEEMQEDLAMEKAGVDDIESNNGQRSPAPITRGNYSARAQSDADMENMLAALGLGAAAVGGGALIGNKMRKGPQIQQQLSRADLYGRVKEPGVMSDSDLYGAPDDTQKMTDADIFADDQTRKMVPGDIEMSLQDEFEQNVKSGEYVDEEVQAVQAIKNKNKVQARNLLPRLKSLGADKRLITALKAIM